MKIAYKGIKKIYIAEILAIVSTIVMIISTLLSMGLLKVSGTALAVSVTSTLSEIFEVIEFILIFIGANQAVKYEKDFKSVRFLVVVLAIVAAVQVALPGNTIVSKGLVVANNALELILILCVIKGCVTMADDLDEKEVSKSGKNVVKIALATFLISIGLFLIVGSIRAVSGGAIMIISETMQAVILVVALLVLIFAYFMYISMLSKTIKMLEDYI